MKVLGILLVTPLLITKVKADFFQNFFNQQQQHHQFHQGGGNGGGGPVFQFDYQEQQLNAPHCQEKYLCPETFECVDSPTDCSCPFPDSQLKCILPDDNYICISKILDEVSSSDDSIDYSQVTEIRDCDWVVKAWKGEL